MIATGVGAFLRFYRIGKECLWFDEICTAGRASFSFGGIIDDLTGSMLFPPLYFLLIRIWVFLAGSSPAALRSFSALWGIAAIPVAYLLAREMFGRKAAVAGSILIIFSSFLIYYSQEAKMYAMWWTLILASNLFFVRAVKQGARWPDLSLYVAVTAAALWTHNFTLLIILSQAIYVVSVLRPRERVRRWLLAFLCVALLYSPWVVIFLVKNLAVSQGDRMGEAITRTQTGTIWIPLPTLKDFCIIFVIFATGIQFYAYELDTWAFSWHMPFLYATRVCILALAVALYPALRGKAGRWKFKHLMALLILFPAISIFLYSRLVKPLWQPRYLGFIAPLLFIALGYVYTLPSRKRVPAAALVVLVVLNFSILNFYYSDRVKKPWDELVTYLSPRVEEGAHIIFSGIAVQRSFEHYWNRDRERKEKRLELEVPGYYWNLDGEQQRRRSKLETFDEEMEEVRKRVANFDDVWLVLSYSMPGRGRLRGKASAEIPGYGGEPVYLGNGLVIIHYVREK